MANTTLQKNDHTMKHIIFIILGAVIVMCLALATGSQALRPNANAIYSFSTRSSHHEGRHFHYSWCRDFDVFWYLQLVTNLSRWDSEYRLKLNATVCECP